MTKIGVADEAIDHAFEDRSHERSHGPRHSVLGAPGSFTGVDNLKVQRDAQLPEFLGSVGLHVGPVPMLVGPPEGRVSIGNPQEDGTLR